MINACRLWPIAVAILGGYLMVEYGSGSLPEPAFYEMAAQVIPVLIVALAVESRAHAFWKRISNLYNAQIVLFLATGELSAVLAASGAVANPDYDKLVGPTFAATQVLLAATVVGLTAGFLSVLVLAFRGATGKSLDPAK